MDKQIATFQLMTTRCCCSWIHPVLLAARLQQKMLRGNACFGDFRLARWAKARQLCSAWSAWKTWRLDPRYARCLVCTAFIVNALIGGLASLDAHLDALSIKPRWNSELACRN